MDTYDNMPKMSDHVVADKGYVRIADLKKNDIANGPGVCVSLWVQGCPHRCKGCHNPETWDYNGGKVVKFADLMTEILRTLYLNGVKRNFSVLGGEPLCDYNLNLTMFVVTTVKMFNKDIKIYLWTGYTIDELVERNDWRIKAALTYIDVIIDGRFIEEEKDISLKLRGSRNQNVIDVKNIIHRFDHLSVT